MNNGNEREQLTKLLLEGRGKRLSGKQIVNDYFDVVELTKRSALVFLFLLMSMAANNSWVGESLVSFLGYSVYPSLFLAFVVAYRALCEHASSKDVLHGFLTIPAMTSVFCSVFMLDDTGNALGDAVGGAIESVYIDAFENDTAGRVFSVATMGAFLVGTIASINHPLNEIARAGNYGFRKFFGMRAGRNPYSHKRITHNDDMEASLSIMQSNDIEFSQLEQPDSAGFEAITASDSVVLGVLQNYGYNNGNSLKVINGDIIDRELIEFPAGTDFTQIQKANKNINTAIGKTAIISSFVEGYPNCISIDTGSENKQIIWQKACVQDAAWTGSKAIIPLMLGTDINREVQVMDLVDFPHCLMAGATGNGKTSALDSIICSLSEKIPATKVQLALIDLKGLDFGAYTSLPNLYAPIAFTEMEAAKLMDRLAMEMDKRKMIFSKAGTKKLETYNAANPNNTLPYIFIVFDEVASAFSGIKIDDEDAEENAKGVLPKITMKNLMIRKMSPLMQKMRAFGFHIIAATQNPTLTAIPTEIQTHLAAKIWLKFNKEKESKDITGSTDAYYLQGNGDALFYNPKSGKNKRIHTPYMTEEDVAASVKRVQALYKQAP